MIFCKSPGPLLVFDKRFQFPPGHAEDLSELRVDGRTRGRLGVLGELRVEPAEVDFDGRGRAGREGEVEEAGVDGAESGRGDLGALLDDPLDGVGVLEEAPDGASVDSGRLREFDEGRGFRGKEDLRDAPDCFGWAVVGREEGRVLGRGGEESPRWRRGVT